MTTTVWGAARVNPTGAAALFSCHASRSEACRAPSPSVAVHEIQLGGLRAPFATIPATVRGRTKDASA